MKKYTKKQLQGLYELIKADQTPDLNEETVKREKVCTDPLFYNCGYYFHTGCNNCPKFNYKPE